MLNEFFIFLEDTKVSKQYKSFGIRQSQQETIIHSQSDDNSDSVFVDKGRDLFKKQTTASDRYISTGEIYALGLLNVHGQLNRHYDKMYFNSYFMHDLNKFLLK